ncbi:MAG: ATP-binding cassette domain-containing protein [Acidimicrobiales bacterium]
MDARPETTVEAVALEKRFGTTEALAGFDLTMARGRVLAVLGPNGAGKTTFVRTVATLLRPDGGTLRVTGIDVTEHPDWVRRAIGLAGQFAAVEPAMTGRENLRMVARLFGHYKAGARRAGDVVLDQMGLTDAGDKLVREYSGGMRRRLDLGASLVGAPRLLLLDEPTTGLDPRSRNELWLAIEALVAQGTDVLLTTQYLDEADRLADDVAIIDRGKVVATGTPSELKGRAGQDVVEVHLCVGVDVAATADGLAASLGGQAPPVSIDTTARRLRLPAARGAEDLVAVVRALDELGAPIEDVALRRPTLDDVFLALTGAPLEPASDHAQEAST